MKNRRWIKKVLTPMLLAAASLMGTSGLSTSGLAATGTLEGHPGFVGGLLGLSSVNNNVGTGIGWGLNGGYFFHENWGVGAFIRGGNHDNGITSFFLGAEALYRLTTFVPGIHLGATLGSGKFSAGGYSGTNNFTYGLKIAYDHLISDTYPITLGADLELLFTKPANDTLTVFNPVVTAKWWF